MGRVDWLGWELGISPFLKTSPLSWLLSCGDWKSRTFFPGISGSRHQHRGSEFEFLCSGVSGSHSQIPERQEQVGLSILML